MDEIREGGGFYRGGNWVVATESPIPLQSLNMPIIHTSLDVKPGVWTRSRHDRLRRIEPGKMYVDVHLTWTAHSWRVTSMVLA